MQASGLPGAEGERGPRKRRRRRGGKRIDGADGVAAQASPGQNTVTQAVRALETPAPVAVKSGGDAKPSLISRIGSKLKSLVTRAPSSRH